MLAEWDRWAREPQEFGELRLSAVQRMRRWLDARQPNESLDLSSLGLTSLPEHLPDSLQKLDASRNRLIRLPQNLSDLNSLVRLNVAYNQLKSVPENITAMERTCHVHLEGNPLPLAVCDDLRKIINAANYQGPTFHFPHSLQSVVQTWHDDGKKKVMATWSNFAYEEGAAEFSCFLDRLSVTVNYKNPAFRHSVKAWLVDLSRHPKLRGDTFAISVGATETCADRVSLTFNDMKKAHLAFAVDNGHYDNRLSELVELARGIYRLEQLEKIAREKVQLFCHYAQIAGEDVNLIDDIEVYLAYQVKLRDRLQLPLEMTDMHHFDMSFITEDDLSQAEQRVKESENEEFAHYLSTQWQPWEKVLGRLHGPRYEETQSQLIEATGDTFQARLAARLKGTGLEHDDDARRIAGPQVMAEIEREIKEPLTEEFLNTRNLPHLLEPQWYLDCDDERTPTYRP